MRGSSFIKGIFKLNKMFYDSLNEKIALIFILQLFYFDWAD